jgi:MFS family permease
LIVTGIVIWSGTTALSGLARNFTELFFARVGVGIGEAALSPAAYSLMRDYFPTDRLARAASVYNVGVHLGGALALFIGGVVIKSIGAASIITVPLLGSIHPWQLIFFAVGAPGLLVALLVSTIREPPRTMAAAGTSGTLRDIGRFFRANPRLMLAHFGGYSLLALISYGAAAWAPTFFIRTFGWSSPEVGYAYGLIGLTAGPIGVLSGGWYADRLYRAGNADATMRAGFHAVLLLAPFAVAAPLVPSPWLSLGLSWIVSLLFAFPFGAAAAAMQLIAPAAIRAQLTALYLFSGTLIGLGLGPLAVGWLTDHVFRDPAKIRYSMATVAAVLTPVSVLLLERGLAPLRKLVERR